MGPELGNLAGRLFTYVDRDTNDAYQRAHEYERDQKRWNVPDAQSAIKCAETIHGRWSVQKNLRDPRHHDQDEDEYVIPLQPSPDRFQFANFEAGQNQIFAHQLFPFALQQLPIFHDHRDQEMSFEHPDSRPKRVIKAVTASFDPQHHPHDDEIEEKDNVWHVAIRERNGNDRGATGDGPVSRDIQPLPPDHDPAHFSPIEMGQGIDVTRVVNTALHRDSRFFGVTRNHVFSCHG